MISCGGQGGHLVHHPCCILAELLPLAGSVWPGGSCGGGVMPSLAVLGSMQMKAGPWETPADTPESSDDGN